MTQTIAVPTLSIAGWVRSPSEKADALIAHFYESDKAQTLLYGDNVANLQFIIEKYGHDTVAVQQQLRTELERYLSRYYDAVNVSVTSDTSSEKSDGKVELRLYADVTEAGKQYSFGKLLVISNSKIDKIMSLNNVGEIVQPN